jgi:hypothetical protein
MRPMAIAAIFAVAILAGNAGAQVNGDPQGLETLRNYVLTMDKVKAYDAATRALQGAAQSDQRLQAEANAISATQQRTLADAVANFGRHPLIDAFYSRQGLGPLDAIVLPVAVSNACSAAAYPQAEAKFASETSPAQIAFCKANLRAIEALPSFNGPPPPPPQ